ncbi:ArnT family glycosyltransferase [Pseudonocardia phyllosphaerae]|uniref:ArnT family glycosyltransferase n=1 Tax=Pseudonocardia phyllosphaerae TaxID=3390502 RepID=UPI00397E7545
MSVAVLLAVTAALYLWDLSASGWSNSFYAAAVQAGANDWTAFFFGSLDPSNAITVDKPPASLWPMEIAARIFGFSSWSLLVPQALMGVAAVGLLYAAVRRVSGHGAGLLAGALLALTPVAALMFRFDNPDALLTLLMTAAAYLVVRGVDDGRTRWIVGAGLVLGFAFLAKSLQAFLVVPGMGLAYAWAAPGRPWRRVWQLLAGGAGIVVGAGWWLLAVALWPVSSRPYIGGSGDNTPLGLAFGYNGIGRITGEEGRGGPGGVSGVGRPGDAAGGLPGGGAPGAGDMTPPGGMGGPGGMAGMGGPGGGMFGGQAGITRMFGESFGTQISWLLPAALVLLVGALVLRGRAGRTDPVRGSLLLWGGWTLVTVVVLSFMSGIVHPYYAVALAPGIAALVAIGGRAAVRHIDRRWVRALVAVTTAGTAVWAFVLLGRAEWMPWLRWTVLVVGVLAGVALLVPLRRWLPVVLGVAVLSGAAAPAAYALQTVATPHTGSIPTAGPGGEGGFGGMRDGRDGRAGAANRAGTARNGAAPNEAAAGMPGAGGDMGGPGEMAANPQLTTLLQNAGPARWAAATTGSQGAASMMLAAGGDTAVMAIGGFSGNDASPTLEQFQQYAGRGDVRYFVVENRGMGGGPGGDRGTGAQIKAWVAQHYTATPVGTATVYDLSAPSR